MLIVFGSINVDGVLTTERLPAPGETIVGAGYAIYPGGKGANQAVAAARYGASVSMSGCVGCDANADFALSALTSAGVDTELVTRSDHTPTAYASVWVDANGENQIIVASGANYALEASAVPEITLGNASTVLLQLEIALEQNVALATRAHASGARVVLNAAPFSTVPDALLAAVDVLVVNEIEARALGAALRAGLGSEPGDEHVAAKALAERFGLTCILTLGARGAVAFACDGERHISSLAVDVVDTTGAGDAFVGTLAAALDEGAELDRALQVAAAAGSLACTRLGAQSGLASRDEILAAQEHMPPVKRLGA